MKPFVVSLLSLLISLNVFAADLTEKVFFESVADVWDIYSIEKVFEDSSADEVVYKVDYSVVLEWHCASNSQVDFCGPKDDDSLLSVCEYFKWNTQYNELEATGVACTESLDSVIDEKLRDED